MTDVKPIETLLNHFIYRYRRAELAQLAAEVAAASFKIVLPEVNFEAGRAIESVPGGDFFVAQLKVELPEGLKFTGTPTEINGKPVGITYWAADGKFKQPGGRLFFPLAAYDRVFKTEDDLTWLRYTDEHPVHRVFVRAENGNGRALTGLIACSDHTSLKELRETILRGGTPESPAELSVGLIPVAFGDPSRFIRQTLTAIRPRSRYEIIVGQRISSSLK
jgi:hypothetical protein